MKGNLLADQLSAAQDRIGGAERRAQQLTEQNRQIKSELNYWNELYAQENEPEHVGEQNEEVESAPRVMLPIAPESSKLHSFRGLPAQSVNVGSAIPTSLSWPPPMISSTVEGANAVPAPPVRNLSNYTSSVGLPIISEESAGISGLTAPPLNPPSKEAAGESFGSILLEAVAPVEMAEEMKVWDWVDS